MIRSKTRISCQRFPNASRNVRNSFYNFSEVYPIVSMLRTLQYQDLTFGEGGAFHEMPPPLSRCLSGNFKELVHSPPHAGPRRIITRNDSETWFSGNIHQMLVLSNLFWWKILSELGDIAPDSWKFDQNPWFEPNFLCKSLIWAKILDFLVCYSGYGIGRGVWMHQKTL